MLPTAKEKWQHYSCTQQNGDRAECGNSRGISLLSFAGKVLSKIMLTRLLEHAVDLVLPESQCGFRRGRSTIDMIFVARQLQEKCREQHQDLYLSFVNLTKALDTVNRVLVDKRNASMIQSSRSLKSATFLLAGWRLSHSKEIPGDLPVLLECNSLTMNTIVVQLSDAVADISKLQCSSKFRILIINAHYVADNAIHALASSATAKLTFNIEEEVVVIGNGWTPKKKENSTVIMRNAGI